MTRTSTDLAIGDAGPRTGEEWADYIVGAYHKSIGAIIETGKRLIEAKDVLEHGQFQAMIKDKLPFSLRTAERFIAIARDARITNPTTWSHLPASWTVLSELTKLDDQAFNAMVAEGSINASMTKLVADNAVWLEKHRKGTRLKSALAAKLRHMRVTLPRPRSGLVRPPDAEVAQELFNLGARLATDLEQWGDVAGAVRALKLFERDAVAGWASDIIAWWTRVHEICRTPAAKASGTPNVAKRERQSQ